MNHKTAVQNSGNPNHRYMPATILSIFDAWIFMTFYDKNNNILAR